MRKTFSLFFVIVMAMQFYSCKQEVNQLINIEEVSPWCIKGFDILDRSPEQRISMLKEMGIKKYGFNRGKGDFSQMKKEFDLATENNIEITSIFLWLNAKRDSLGKLSEANQEILDNLNRVDQKPTIWLSFSNNYFENRSELESINFSIEMINFVKEKADEIGCALAIYNHHGWFGNPYNQIKILEKLNQESISMAYNFHHAHEYIDDFREVAKLIVPHLSYVNINGMKKDGPQILTIGEGDHELEMIKMLKDEGFDGPWGILGHIKTEDVQEVLKRNIAGLKALNSKHINSN